MILDTNVWTYIGERNEQHRLEELEHRLDIELVLPPSMLLEALNTPVPHLRASIVAAMTSRRGHRVHPLPEARLESDEVVAQARTLRPGWVKRFPQPTRVRSLEAFWTRRLWQEAARDPERVANASTGEMDSLAETIVQVQRENKETMLADGFRLDDSEAWVDLSGQPAEIVAGWDGQRIEAWRAESALTWWSALVTRPRQARRILADTSYADWAGVWLNLDAIALNREQWNRFWYHEVEAAAMPRAWLRSALPWVQLQTKLGTGNPRDAQHAAYLVDADVFITADRRLHQGLEVIRDWGPVTFAETRLVTGTGSIGDALGAALDGV